MIPAEHRTKGGAPLLGAEEPGLPGPFGTWAEEDDQEQEEALGVSGRELA
ncbi:hypothetical protein [Streptacidiphilus carbonis]|nr:hypothetical protein [Streptacidiphilus carbonis]